MAEHEGRDVPGAGVDATGQRRAPLVWVGVLAAAVGVVVGLVMLVSRTEVACAEGTTFPPGMADPRCFAHPGGLVGTAVIALSIALGALVYLVGQTVDRR